MHIEAAKPTKERRVWTELIPRRLTLAAKLCFLNGYQEICDIDTYRHDAPGPADIPEILAIG